MTCPQCRTENPPQAKFCLGCGTRLAQGCASCGVELPAGARFCFQCGAPVTAPVTAAGREAQPASPESYTPRYLAERILTSRSALEGEHKAVTVLFCDITGSTALAERLGAEGMHGLLGRFFESALAEVHRYEGTINQFLGDGFMALFGAPVAHEDHARRAVLAALGIRRALEARPLEAEPGRPVSLAVRMGLHTGQVVIGAIGDNLRMDYTAVGDTTHLAARLQQAAEPGAILVSQATARLAEGHVRLEPLGPMRFKGIGDPVGVWRVEGSGPPRAPLDQGDGRTLSPFVGRGRDLGTLQDLLAESERGRGRAIGIAGEPGLGKSRLLLEFRRGLADRPVTYLAGRCVSYGAAIPYLPVLDLVRAACGLAESATPEAAAETVRATVVGLGLDPEATTPYVLHALGVKTDTDRLGAMGAEAVKARTLESLRQLVLRSSQRRPVVVEIEDLHWVDRTSEEYLESLVERLGGARVLLLATYRPGYRPGWLEKSYATQLALGRLGPEDSLLVARAVLGEIRVPDRLGTLILDRAEGNPFFIEELTRAVGEAGGLGPTAAVPDTVHGILAARIDRLGESAKRVLQTASTLGRRFPVRLLSAVWDGGEAVEPHLRELVRLEFLYEEATADEPTYAFKHALTQEVAEATLLGPRRRGLHRRVGEALESLYPHRRRELVPVLAEHYHRAEAWPLASARAREAAVAAQGAGASREALTHLDRALEAAMRGGLGGEERLAIHEARGDVRALVGDFEPAREDLEAALALAEARGDAPVQARVLGALGALWGGHKDYALGLELASRAVEVAETTGDPRVRAEAWLRVGLMRLNLARLAESRHDLEKALALFREAGDAHGEARALDLVAMRGVIAGDTEGSRDLAREAIPRLRAVGDRPTEASSTVMLALLLAYLGERDEAERHFGLGRELAVSLGARSLEAWVCWAGGEAAELFGAYGTALREATAGLAIAGEIGHLEWTAGSLGIVGRVRRSCNDVEGARRAHDEMLAIARRLGTTLWIAGALGEVGADLLAAGRLDEAATQLAVAVAASGEAAEFASRPLVALADLALRRGRAAEAVAAARHARQISAGYRVVALDAHRLEGEGLAALGQAADAETTLRAVKADATRFRAAPPRWRACLALADLLAARGRVAEAAAERAEALGLLEAAAEGLPPDLREAFDRGEPLRRARGG